MNAMVRVAVAGDVTEAEEIQAILGEAGVASELEPGEDDSITILVRDTEVEVAQDAIEAMTEPDELASDV